ncbi:hypothetical protein L873DRAFT_1830346 [Choiromyces venosus 120613-1]|uniref:AA9 family lytic polysaccharide monooxygenase n=1 Tax=Choiromyces venosus 120613-1 TaxID=1336337 RepID=A0A3N4JKJ5_9PEZI|nr:hypothetical protein L873DRAFT_1830346 [Choiromyces venosus 120613-1]
MKSSIAVLAALAGCSYDHTIFQELYVNGVSTGHLKGIRVPDYDGPITDVTSNDIICNGGINPYHTPPPTDIIAVPAGATQTADGDDPISPGHLGPAMVYLAKVDNALTTTVMGLKWFKIYEDGLDSSGIWAVTRRVNNKGKVAVKIPSCIPSGNYLLRAEIIALHGASTYPGAQFYIECAQINVTGGGSASPATVSFPGVLGE